VRERMFSAMPAVVIDALDEVQGGQGTSIICSSSHITTRRPRLPPLPSSSLLARPVPAVRGVPPDRAHRDTNVLVVAQYPAGDLTEGYLRIFSQTGLSASRGPSAWVLAPGEAIISRN